MKYVYASVLSAIVLIVGLAMLIPGCIYTIIPLIIIGGLICVYIIIIAGWLFGNEIPKYKVHAPGYYDIWFENQASDLGQKYFGTKYEETIE